MRRVERLARRCVFYANFPTDLFQDSIKKLARNSRTTCDSQSFADTRHTVVGVNTYVRAQTIGRSLAGRTSVTAPRCSTSRGTETIYNLNDWLHLAVHQKISSGLNSTGAAGWTKSRRNSREIEIFGQPNCRPRFLFKLDCGPAYIISLLAFEANHRLLLLNKEVQSELLLTALALLSRCSWCFDDLFHLLLPVGPPPFS